MALLASLGDLCGFWGSGSGSLRHSSFLPSPPATVSGMLGRIPANHVSVGWMAAQSRHLLPEWTFTDF